MDLTGVFGALVLVLAAAWGAHRYTLRRQAAEVAERRAAEERFRHLTALSADWFWEADAKLRITWVSGGASLAEFLGGERLRGRVLTEIEAEIAPAARAALTEQVAGGLPFFDIEMARGAGERQRVHLVSGEPRYDAAGRLLGWRGVGRDHSERRRAGQAVADARDRLALALEGGDLAWWESDLASGRFMLSAGWQRILGGEPAETRVCLESFLGQLHPEDVDAVRTAWVAFIKGETGRLQIEARVRTVLGGWRWAAGLGRITARDPASGRALSAHGVAQDIDARKRAEQALSSTETRYRTLVELAPDGVALSANGVIEYANEALARMLRVGSAAELVGTHALEWIHAEDRRSSEARMAQLAEAPGLAEFIERRVLCADGSVLPVEVAAISYFDRGRLVLQSVLRDASRRARTEQALRESEIRYRQIAEFADDFAFETDAEWRWRDVSPGIERVLGLPPETLPGRLFRDSMPLPDAQRMADWFERRRTHPAPFRDQPMRVLGRDGAMFELLLDGFPVWRNEGGFAGYRGTARLRQGRRAGSS